MAPAKLVSFYLYLQIIFGALLGVLFFKEIPDLFNIFGAFLMIISEFLSYKFKNIPEIKFNKGIKKFSKIEKKRSMV